MAVFENNTTRKDRLLELGQINDVYDRLDLLNRFEFGYTDMFLQVYVLERAEPAEFTIDSLIEGSDSMWTFFISGMATQAPDYNTVRDSLNTSDLLTIPNLLDSVFQHDGICELGARMHVEYLAYVDRLDDVTKWAHNISEKKFRGMEIKRESGANPYEISVFRHESDGTVTEVH